MQYDLATTIPAKETVIKQVENYETQMCHQKVMFKYLNKQCEC